MDKKKSSKELLRESVIELVSSLPVDKVTVGMICKNCGISQRSFYNHFKDKYDLISWSYTSILYDSINDAEKESALHNQLISLVSHIYEKHAFYTNVIKYTGQNNFRHSVYVPLREYLLTLIKDQYGDTITDDIRDSVNFFIFGCLGYMEFFLITGNIVPPEITVPLFEKNIPASLRKYLS